MSGSGVSPHASACAACALPTSPPPGQAHELFDMFCALNGATRKPRCSSHAQIAVVRPLWPACDAVPPTKMGLALKLRLPSRGLLTWNLRRDGERLPFPSMALYR